MIGFFFNGGYALLGDVDRVAAADAIFELKRRPRAKTLSLVTDPRFWGGFVDLDHPAMTRHPLDRAAALHDRLHAVGIVYPADRAKAPAHLVEDGTILNVWSRYGPLIALQEACRDRGLRALLGASANISGAPTATTIDEMRAAFGDDLPLIVAEDPAVPPNRRQSVSLVDLCGPAPTLLREGNTTEDEVRTALAEVGLGRLVVSPSVVRL